MKRHKKCDQSNMDGEVQNFAVLEGDANVYNTIKELPGNEYFNADGDGDDYYSADGKFLSNLRKSGGKLFSNMRENRLRRQARRDVRTQSKADARTLKGQSKLGYADAQKESAKAAQMGVAADVETAKALSTGNPSGDENKGMSTGVKIAIGSAAALVLIGVIYFAVKHKKK